MHNGRALIEGPIPPRYRASCWSTIKVGSPAPGIVNQVSPRFRVVLPPASVYLPPGFSLFALTTNCALYDVWDSWRPAPNGSATFWMKTTMSILHLPPEMLDHIVDLRHDTEPVLRNCCLLSKSRIPRTRINLFANISFHAEGKLRRWREIFPNPSTSPARHVKTLFIGCSCALRATDAEVCGWD